MNGSNMFSDDIAAIWDYAHSVDQYVAQGGTSRQSVCQQLGELKKWIVTWNERANKRE